MSLVTKKVSIGIGGNNLQHFESLGYVIPRYKDKKYRMSILKGTCIDVSVDDLLPCTRIEVECRCDGCGKSQFIKYADYYKNKRENGESYCRPCSIRLFGAEKRRQTMLKNGNTVYDWAINSDRQDILHRWDECNEYKPDELTVACDKLVYIMCPLGIHESQLKQVSSFTQYNLPLYCEECNLLGNKFPESKNVWSDENELSPFDYQYGTQKYVYWKCENAIHPDYRRNINNAVYANFHCPACVKLNKESSLQKKVFDYLNNMKNNYDLEYNQEFKTRLICRNSSRNNYILPYDNEIIGNNFGLIVEVNGEQHSKITSWHKSIAIRDGLSSAQEVLDYQIERDEIKKQYALSNGYYYLVLPYYTEKSGEWEILLSDMFQHIFNNSQKIQ